METTFADWLREELRKRGWNQAELSKRSYISASQITRALSGERGLGEQSVLGIAKALDLPPEEVYRAAGFLPPIKEKQSKADELTHLVSQMDDQEIDELIAYARFRLGRQRDKTQVNEKSSRIKRPARNALKG